MLGLPTQSAQQAGFDPGMAYLQANPDVASNPYYSAHPLDHYNEHGKSEGRKWPTAQAATAAQPVDAAKAQQDAFAKFRAMPGYQFGLDEGNKSVQASAAARGGLNSGATLKALLRYGQNYADQQGVTPYMNRLASLFGGAQTATNQLGQAGQNYANQVGNNLKDAGQARAQGIYDSQNAWTNYTNSMNKQANNWAAQNQWGGV